MQMFVPRRNLKGGGGRGVMPGCIKIISVGTFLCQMGLSVLLLIAFTCYPSLDVSSPKS